MLSTFDSLFHFFCLDNTQGRLSQAEMGTESVWDHPNAAWILSRDCST